VVPDPGPRTPDPAVAGPSREPARRGTTPCS
jgi:hypothetical protein